MGGSTNNRPSIHLLIVLHFNESCHNIISLEHFKIHGLAIFYLGKHLGKMTHLLTYRTLLPGDSIPLYEILKKAKQISTHTDTLFWIKHLGKITHFHYLKIFFKIFLYSIFFF